MQDTWSVNRLTLNIGGRYDMFNASIPPESSPTSTWIQARDFAEIPDVPDWNDWSVRLAGAYDVFGNGKTALKANASKYIAAEASGYTQNFNPMSYSTQTRVWVDLDRNKSILDANGNIQFNEVIGGTSNFGQITNRHDPNLERGYNWEYSASVQHELMERVSMNAGFYRRQFYNLDVIDNQNLALTDWTPFGITTPTDPRLPLSGQPIEMHTLNANKVGVATDNLRTFSDINRTIYNGFELSANLRREKLLLFGGINTERRASTDCDGSTTAVTTARDNPNGLRFCDSVPPFRTTFKMSGAYSAAVGIPVERHVHGDSGRRRRRELRRDRGDRGPADYRLHRRCDDDPREPDRTQHGVPRLPEEAGPAPRAQLPRRSLPHPGLRRHLQRAERRHGGCGSTRPTAPNPATNQWLTPLGIMEARYVRFGVQMSF